MPQKNVLKELNDEDRAKVAELKIDFPKKYKVYLEFINDDKKSRIYKNRYPSEAEQRIIDECELFDQILRKSNTLGNKFLDVYRKSIKKGRSIKSILENEDLSCADYRTVQRYVNESYIAFMRQKESAYKGKGFYISDKFTVDSEIIEYEDDKIVIKGFFHQTINKINFAYTEEFKYEVFSKPENEKMTFYYAAYYVVNLLEKKLPKKVFQYFKDIAVDIHYVLNTVEKIPECKKKDDLAWMFRIENEMVFFTQELLDLIKGKNDHFFEVFKMDILNGLFTRLVRWHSFIIPQDEINEIRNFDNCLEYINSVKETDNYGFEIRNLNFYFYWDISKIYKIDDIAYDVEQKNGVNIISDEYIKKIEKRKDIAYEILNRSRELWINPHTLLFLFAQKYEDEILNKNDVWAFSQQLVFYLANIKIAKGNKLLKISQ